MQLGDFMRRSELALLVPHHLCERAARIMGEEQMHVARELVFEELLLLVDQQLGVAVVAHRDRHVHPRPARDEVGAEHHAAVRLAVDAVRPDDHGEVLAVDDAVFLKAQTELKQWDDVTLRKFQAIIAMFDVPACGIVLRAGDGRVVSSALMAVADGIVITGNVITDAAERGRGYGKRMMRTGFAWAHANGARTAALNVAADNVAGHALYASLGYRRQYDYVYRTPGPER